MRFCKIISAILALSLMMGAAVASANEAKIGDTPYTTVEAAFAAAASNQTITLLTDADVEIKRYRTSDAQYFPNNNADHCTVDLNGKTLTILNNNGSETDDFCFRSTTFKNGTLTLEEGLNCSTAIFWMFDGHKLVFDNVTLNASGVSGVYLIGSNGGSTECEIKGSEIIANNDSMIGITVYAGNGDATLLIDNSNVHLNNVKKGILHGTTTISNGSDIEMTNVETGMDHSTFVIDKSSVSISNASERAVRLNDDTVVLQNNGQLILDNCKNDIVLANGTAKVEVDKSSILIAETDPKIETDIKTNAPILVDADNKSYADGSASFTGAGSLIFKSTADFEFFKRAAVMQNGKVLAEVVAPKLENADGGIVVSEGSIKVTLNEGFLSGLNNGMYTIVIEDLYSEGVEGTFNVAVSTGDMPQTGDASQMMLWVALLGMAGAAMMLRKRAQN